MLRRLARLGRMVGPAALCGVLVALSLPPFGWWPLAFAGAGGMWWRLDGLRTMQRFAAGWFFGLGMFAVGLWWVTEFNVYGGVALMLMQALAPAFASALAPSRSGRTVSLVGTMVLLEWLRSSWPAGGLPLGGLALGQASGPAADVARIGGPRLIVGLVWLGGAGVGLAVSTVVRVWRHGRAEGREAAGWRELTGGPPPIGVRGLSSPPVLRPLLSAVAALAVTAGVCGLGAVAADGGPATGIIRVAAVQGGGVRGLSKEQVAPSTVFDAAVSATRALLARSGPRPQLIVWPEDVVGLDHQFAGSAEEQTIAALATDAHATLLAGVTEPAGPSHFRNFIVAFAPSGKVVSTYEKVHRVPFGEYIPWRALVEHLADVSAVPQDAIPGTGDGVLRTPVGRLGTMISYEVFFSDRGRLPTRAGAGLLVVPTNTSSYVTGQVPTQEIAASKLQALSEGRDLLQASPTGFSALIDHDGRVLERSSLGVRALMVGKLSTRTGATLYERFGELVPVLAGLVALIIGWALALNSPRRP